MFNRYFFELENEDFEDDDEYAYGIMIDEGRTDKNALLDANIKQVMMEMALA